MSVDSQPLALGQRVHVVCASLTALDPIRARYYVGAADVVAADAETVCVADPMGGRVDFHPRRRVFLDPEAAAAFAAANDPAADPAVVAYAARLRQVKVGAVVGNTRALDRIDIRE